VRRLDTKISSSSYRRKKVFFLKELKMWMLTLQSGQQDSGNWLDDFFPLTCFRCLTRLSFDWRERKKREGRRERKRERERERERECVKFSTTSFFSSSSKKSKTRSFLSLGLELAFMPLGLELAFLSLGLEQAFLSLEAVLAIQSLEAVLASGLDTMHQWKGRGVVVKIKRKYIYW
jgi:hypothetical protein